MPRERAGQPPVAWPVAQYVAMEMVARGWTLDDVVLHMNEGEDVPADRLALDFLVECAYEPDLVLGSVMAGKLARAFEVSPDFLLQIDALFRSWRDLGAAPTAKPVSPDVLATP